jgi:uncharacterized membrane protein
VSDTSVGVSRPGARGRLAVSWWALGVWGATAVYTILLSLESLADYYGFRTGVDSAIYDQQVWLLANWHEPFSTVLNRHMLGEHFQPGLALLVPLYWLGGGIAAVLVAQTVAIALTAPALYALARSAGASPGLASVPAFLWLASPAVSATNLFDWRAATFASALVVLSVLAGLQNRPVLLAVTALVALSLKEDIALTYVMLGGLLAWHGRRRLGAVLAAGAAGWALVALVTLRWLGDSDEFLTRRFAGDRGDSVRDALAYVVRNPVETFVDIVQHSGADLLLLLASTGGLALLAPSWMLLALPTAAHNLLAAYEPQHTLNHHYHLPVLAAFFVASALGVSRLDGAGRRLRLAIAGGVATAVAIGVVGSVVGPHDFSGRLSAAERTELERALERIPGDAPVAAAPHLLPRLSHRKEVYSFPEPFVRIDWANSLSDEELAERARRVRFVALTGDIKPLEYKAEIAPIVQRLLAEDFVVVESSPVRNLLILERRG